MQPDFNIWKSITFRFLRGFAAGAFSSMATFITASPDKTDLKQLFAGLLISLIIGGITGAILATDKYLRSPEE